MTPEPRRSSETIPAGENQSQTESIISKQSRLLNVLSLMSSDAVVNVRHGGRDLTHHGYLPSFFSVSVGYEYESCLDVVLWEKRTASLQGYELDASNMGGWMLDKHHVLDIQTGKCNSCSLCVITKSVAYTGGPFRFTSRSSLPRITAINT